MQTFIWCFLHLLLSVHGIFMQTSPNTKCFKHNGKYGFYAVGGVRMWCGSDCLPHGKAEWWCMQCCGMTSTTHSPPSRSTSAPTTASSRSHMAQPEVIALASALGAIVFLLMLAGLVYFLSKKFKCRKPDSHSVETCTFMPSNGLPQQVSGDARSNEQQRYGEVVMPGNSVFTRQFSDGS